MESVVAVRRVMVCDDTPSIRGLIRINLELEGCVVEEAADATSALRRLLDPLASPFDLLLLDAHMAPQDGWWLIAQIRRRPQFDRLPVVLVSAATHGLDPVHTEAAGFDAVLAKPFDPDDLLAVVSRTTRGGGGARGSQ